MAGDLSGGEQQMLALGGALMTRPELLMIDELSLGLAPTIVGQLLEVVQEIHRRGTTLVIVQPSVHIALHRKRVVSGKRVYVRGVLGGSRIMKQLQKHIKLTVAK